MTKLDASLFVSDDAQERTVTLADGSEHVMYFREVPASTFRLWQDATQSDKPEVRASASARLIAASLATADGLPALTIDEAAKLKPRVAAAIFGVVLEVCGFSKDGEAKNDSPSGETSGSGTSSL